MSRLTLVLLAVVLVGCSSRSGSVRVATGCDGADGSCVRYIPAVDGEGAPLDRATVLVPFTGDVRVGQVPEGFSAVTATVNLEKREPELKLVPVRSVRADPSNPRQVLIELDGMLADGGAIDLPEGLIRNGKGKDAGAITLKLKTPLSPFAIALAGIVWEPAERELFGEEGVEKPNRAKAEGDVRQELESRLRIRPGITDEQVGRVLARYDADATKKRARDHRVRAGLLMLTGTSAEYAIDFVLAETNRRGVPFEPIEVRPIADLGAFAAVSYHPLVGRLRMFIDTELAADTLENIATAIAHEALHSGLGGGSASEETLAMAADTRVYEEFLLFDPALARNPSPFTRQQNQLVLALRNSGRFGYPRAGILPRPGVDDALRGTGEEPARSFRDLLFKPDVYGDIPRAGDTGSEIVESYYQRIAGTTAEQGRLKLDNNTIKLFDKVMDNGITDEQILAIADALNLKPVALPRPAP